MTSPYIRTGQRHAASRFGFVEETGVAEVYAWGVMDSVEIEGMSEDPRAWAHVELERAGGLWQIFGKAREATRAYTVGSVTA